MEEQLQLTRPSWLFDNTLYKNDGTWNVYSDYGFTTKQADQLLAETNIEIQPPHN